jgi:hypothetical protein
MDGLAITMILPRILWGLIKGVLLVLIIYHLFSTIFIYPDIDHNTISVANLFAWVSEFVSSNWLYLVGLFVLYYSWSSARKVRAIDARIQQIEVIAFAEVKYFKYWPETDILRNTESFSDLVKNFVIGWLASLFNINNPKDLPWSAKPVRDGEEVSFLGDIRKDEEKDV